MLKKKTYEKLKKICIDESEETVVFGEGNLDAKIVLIGEAPGSKEIELRKPFVGQAGKNLNEFLKVVELEREDIYITNVVKIRPYRINKETGRKVNRPPNKNEIEKYSKILFQELEIIRPRLIVTLGNVPLKTLTSQKNIKVGEVHGNIIETKEYTIFPLYHPAAIIYNRNLKDIYFEDLIKLKKHIKK
ncbi:uracil-DNA glycosylase [Maledivibacter halophilus]|uniref:Type-4 uracil-DNA glycosylase n=1 Tax=Maledivibacter halophilus TaxID=36842 RepID=A0A1T5MLE6_9FIRM|nr:uracil-DNA glycosylase [Maledivibacter halophilus]SKC88804.1 DNA polymerase [Maledivibacter halophilus]